MKAALVTRDSFRPTGGLGRRFARDCAVGLQCLSAAGAFGCLFLLGFSGWTLLAALGAAGSAAFSLRMQGDETDAPMEVSDPESTGAVAEFVAKGAQSRKPRLE